MTRFQFHVFKRFSDTKKKPTVSTLSMSFQHFSTIFLSTTAGCWGWGGCWWGWKASFIKPMRPAPLLGFPAINSVSNRGLAPGLRVTTRDYSWRVFQQNDRRFAPYLHRTLGLIWHAKPVGEQNKKSCVCTLYATQLANKLHLKRSLSFNSDAKYKLRK